MLSLLLMQTILKHNQISFRLYFSCLYSEMISYFETFWTFDNDLKNT